MPSTQPMIKKKLVNDTQLTIGMGHAVLDLPQPIESLVQKKQKKMKKK